MLLEVECCLLLFVGVRFEILDFVVDEQLRKHLPRMFSLIKNESSEIEDDRIPS